MDWQLTCRVCLETGDMVSLFDWDENNEQLGDKFTYCCGIEVVKNDPLPTLICLACVDRLMYAYQFKQQCLSSNETLKECLEEFEKSSNAIASASTSRATETEVITIKQENGLLLQYELPVEQEPQTQWTRTVSKVSGNSVVTKAPGPRKRGRPRKYPDEQGQINVSPYQRKKPKKKEEVSLTTLLATGTLDLKQEPEDEQEETFGDDFVGEDPDFNPVDEFDVGSETEKKYTPRKRGRPRKIRENKKSESEEKQDDGEDVLLKETILAFTEPIPEHILNPKPKKKYPYKKRHSYEKTHTCETCGSSFTSNASLQTHIRRHLGIKPFVCSVCGFSTFARLGLMRHMRRHTGEKHLQCRHCTRMFYEHGDREKHESVCGYACVMNEALRRHMLRHTGERPYKCRICDRRFGDFGTRQKHERLHMGLKPYQCTLCGKSFTYSYVLSNHMLTHTGEKKYACTPCNKKFTKAHHLKYHNKVHHKELYIQQQLEAEAKKLRQQGVLAGAGGTVTAGYTLVNGTLQLVSAEGEVDGEMQMQVVEEQEEGDVDPDGDKETHEAVQGMQGMQAIVLEAEFGTDEDVKNENILNH